MSRGKAIVLAMFTVWPVLYIVLFMGAMAGMMVSDFSGSGRSADPRGIMLVLVPLHFFTMAEIIVLLVIFLRHVFKTDRVAQDKKALWAAVLFLGYPIAMPIYWYLYIWNGPTNVTGEMQKV